MNSRSAMTAASRAGRSFVIPARFGAGVFFFTGAPSGIVCLSSYVRLSNTGYTQGLTATGDTMQM